MQFDCSDRTSAGLEKKGEYTMSVDNRNNTFLTNNNLFLSFNSDHPYVSDKQHVYIVG